MRIQAICLGQKMPEEYWSRWVNSAPALLWPNMLDIVFHVFSSAFQRRHSFFKIFEKKFWKNTQNKLQIALYRRFLNYVLVSWLQLTSCLTCVTWLNVLNVNLLNLTFNSHGKSIVNVNLLRPWLSLPLTENSSLLFSSCHLELVIFKNNKL